MLRMGKGFYSGIILWTLPGSLYRIHVPEIVAAARMEFASAGYVSHPHVVAAVSIGHARETLG